MSLNFISLPYQSRLVISEAFGCLSVEHFIYVLRRSSVDACGFSSRTDFYEILRGDSLEWFDSLMIMRDSDWNRYCVVDARLEDRVMVDKLFFDCVVRMLSFLLDFLRLKSKPDSGKWGGISDEKKYIPSWKRLCRSVRDLEYTP